MKILLFDVSWWKLPIATFIAFIGGIMNATSGGGSFLTYPSLLALGESHIGANATSTVGLWPGLIANLPGFKDEISSNKKFLKIFVVPTLIGASIGAFILTRTSDNVFGFVAPILIFTGAIVLQFHHKLEHFFDHMRMGSINRRTVVVTFVVFIIAIYAAYFGAGIGVLFLAAFSFLHLENFYHSVAIKNVLALVANTVATIYFSFTGLIHWPISIAMALGSIAGGIFGAKIIRKIDKEKLRSFVVVYGLATSVILLILQLI
ncbi:MAG: sulfite exporter TauE/SafE family protein [Acidimicrobiia bacterium]